MTLEVKVSKKLVPYATAYKKLRKRVDSIKKGKSRDLLWILEHPLTFTGGIRSNEKEILDLFSCTIETPLEVSETEGIDKFNKLLKMLCNFIK